MAQANLLIFLFAWLTAPGATTQADARYSKHKVEARTDGFLDTKTNINDIASKKEHQKRGLGQQFTWNSVPRCGLDLFEAHQPTIPDENGMKKLLPGLDAFFIIHDGSHEKRKSRLETLMRDSRLDGLDQLATWVDWFSEEDLREIPHEHLACVFNRTYAEPMFSQSVAGPLSRNLKHLWVYHEMLRRRLNNVLVMEDNPVFRATIADETLPKLQELMSDLVHTDEPEIPHIVMLGDGDLAQGHKWRAAEIQRSFEDDHRAQRVTKHLYGPGDLGQRGASGYVMTATSAAAILQYVYNQFRVDAEADMLMENALGPHDFYWYVPPLWVQSESAVMVELTSSNQTLLATRPSWQSEAVVPPVQPAYDQDSFIKNHGWSRYHKELARREP